MKPTPMITERVLALLEVAPMTAQALSGLMLDATTNRVTAVLHRLREQGRVHIHQWDRNECGGRLYPRAIYALGSGLDARKPPRLPRKVYCARYKAKRRAAEADAQRANRPRVTSVWDLAKS